MKNSKKLKFKTLLFAAIACTFFNYTPANAQYTNLQEAISDTTTPREYTLSTSESINAPLGDMGGTNATLTIDGSSDNYGINANNVVGITVNSGNTLILKNLGSVTVNGDGKSVSDYVVNSSVNGFVSPSGDGFVHNSDGTLTITDSVFSNNSARDGVVISNVGVSANVTEITNVTFYGNRTSDLGGAIYNNSGASIGNINADFVNNIGEDPHIYGLGIYNRYSSSIGNISGKFVGNTIDAEQWAVADVYNANNSSIGDISSDFIGNYAKGLYLYGGNIFNSASSIGNITGNFENNIAICEGTYLSGSVISNVSGSTIGDITGNFKSNTATALNGTLPGIISNQNSSTIGNITGNFENNSLSGNTVYGYIYNQTSQIGNITGDFKNNTLSGTVVYGGIMNSNSYATINKIEGVTFEGNTATGTSVAIGGAITNLGTITNGIINSKFLNNKDIAPSADGAAIYTNKDLNIIADGSIGDGISTFKGNYIKYGDNIEYEAIFIASAARTLTFNAKNGGTINLYDYAYGVSGYDTHLTGDSDSTINLYNDIFSSDVTADNVNINLANDETHDYEFLTLNSNANTKWTIDFDADNLKTDTIKTTSASSGIITIENFNIKGNTSAIPQGTKIQILKTPNENLQLVISDAAKEIIDQDTYEYDDTVTADNTWNKEYYHHTVVTNTVVDFTLAKTDTENDSISITQSSTPSTDTKTLIGNTLSPVNQADIGDRNFTTTDATATYNATSNLGETAAGTFTVSGASAGDNKSTINLGDYTGFELNNDSTLNLNDVIINGTNNVISSSNSNAKVNITNSVINGNITAAESTPLDLTTEGKSELNGTISNVTLTNNGDLVNGGTISGNIDNKSGASLTTNIGNLNGTVTNDGRINAVGNSSTSNYIQGNGDIYVTSGTTTINHNINGNTLYLEDGSNLILSGNKDISQGGLVANGGVLAGISDNQISTYNLGNVTLNQNLNIEGIDFRVSDSTTDTFTGSYTGSGKIAINNINVLGDSITKDSLKVSLSELTGIDNSYLSVRDQQLKDIMTPIRKLSGSVSNNYITYAPAGSSAADFNPAILASPVSAQLGGYLTQVQTLQEGFYHLDRYSKISYKERQAAENANKYAISEQTSVPTYKRSEIPETSKAMWVIPYTSFEKVNLRGGINVDNITYGALYGGDTDLYDLGNGYKGVISAYIGYNGSHQSYNGISMNQQGGTLGVTGTLYKNNFFTALTVSAGASAGQAYTSYGTDNFALLTAGAANRTGYNFELADGKLIIQPQIFLGYVFVNPFDYTSASGVRISSDPLNTIQVAPGLKIIGNLKHGWRPYAGIDVMMNFMGNTKYMANETRLPELSVKPYVQYGLGIQKSFGEVFTGFFQTMLRNGGRTGIVLTAGFRWTIGRKNSKSSKTKQKQKTVIKKMNDV